MEDNKKTKTRGFLASFFNLTNFFGTVTVFVFMWLLQSISLNFDFLNVFEQVLSDYDLTDVYYTKFRQNEQVPFEDEVILVNIGNLSRSGIAEEIRIISKYNPKVIGIDGFFVNLKPDEPEGDSLLSEAIKGCKNFVLGTKVDMFNPEKNTWDTLIKSNEIFSATAHSGFVNVISEEGKGDFVTWRSVPAVEKLTNGQIEPCFAAKIMEFYNKDIADKFYARGNEVEQIYFKGNLDKYVKLDVDDVLSENFDSTLLQGKIVVMGYMGAGYTDYFWDEDRFYTPLNENQVGRGYPDMYGVVVHANIISMMLEDKYVDELPSWVAYLAAFLVCYFNIAVFINILESERFGLWYNVLSKLIQLVQAIAFFSIDFFSFALYNVSVDLTLATFAILLSGDLAEIYVDVILNSVRRVLNKFKPAKELER
jgi:CHASE2 domain-containing sensor protein